MNMYLGVYTCICICIYVGVYTHRFTYNCLCAFFKTIMCIVIRFHLKVQNFLDVEMELSLSFGRLGNRHCLKPNWAALQDPASKNKNKQDIVDGAIRIVLLWTRPCKFELISNASLQQGWYLFHIGTQLWWFEIIWHIRTFKRDLKELPLYLNF